MDRIASARNATIMRRINALEAVLTPTTTDYAVTSSASGVRGFDIDSSGEIWIGSGAGNEALVIERTNLTPSRLIDDYPGSETEFPTSVNILSGDIYSFFNTTKFKYDIGAGTWSSLSGADSSFTDRLVSGVRGGFANNGTDWHCITDRHDIERYNSSGVSQETIVFDTPTEANSGSGEIWVIRDFGFAGSGSIIAIIAAEFSGATGNFDYYVIEYDTDGAQIDTLVDLGNDDGGGHSAGVEISIEVDGDGDFVVGYIIDGGDSSYNPTSFSADGTELASDLGGVDVDSDILYGMRYSGNEIFLTYKENNDISWLVVVNRAGTELDRLRLVTQTENTQTTWHRYPRPIVDTGKVSLGTPDAGVTVPLDTAFLEDIGFGQFRISHRPHRLELTDMRSALETELARRSFSADSGTTDGVTTANKLIDSSQNFSSTVAIGDIVRNITDGTTAGVTAIDSNTTLSINANIMASGDVYEILGIYSTDASPVSRNIFDIAIGSQTDWTHEPAGDRVREDHFTDLESILDEIEGSEVVAT